MIENSRFKESSLHWGTQKGEAKSIAARGTVSITNSDGSVSRAIGSADDLFGVTEFDQEFRKNNLAFEKAKDELFRNYIGKWVAFENGKMIVADSPEELKLPKDVKHRIIVKITEKLLKQPKEVYLGGRAYE